MSRGAEFDQTKPILIKQVQGGKRFDRKAWKEEKTTILRHHTDFKPAAQPAPLDAYGGVMRGERQAATGFFHLKKLGARWWLIDPEGWPYYTAGTTHIGIAVNGSAPRAEFSKHFASEAQWVETTSNLFKEIGINSGDDNMARLFPQNGHPMPYFMALNFFEKYFRAKNNLDYKQARDKFTIFYTTYACTDDFAQFIRGAMKKMARPRDPYLIGYWSDNELQFPMGAKHLLEQHLALPANEIPHQVAAAWLERNKIDPSSITEEINMKFKSFIVECYHRTCREAIKGADPNHLNCGFRINNHDHVQQTCREFYEALGPYIDMACLNWYNQWTPDPKVMDSWAAWMGDKPFMVTEWYAKAMDSGLNNREGAGFSVPTQQERAWYYENFTLGLLQNKGCVGWHWFCYQDHLVGTPRASNKGIVNWQFQPYPELCASIKAINTQVYDLIRYFDTK